MTDQGERIKAAAAEIERALSTADDEQVANFVVALLKAQLAKRDKKIERLRDELDELEERYEWLLGEVGGVSPR